MSELQAKSNEALFEEAVQHLKFAIQVNSNSQRRVAKRVRHLIRAAAVGVSIALIFILVLLVVLVAQISTMTRTLNDITAEAEKMNQNVENIEIALLSFEAQMTSLGHMTHSVMRIRNNVTAMNGHVKHLGGDMMRVQNEIDQLDKTLAYMGRHVSMMNASMHIIERDVYKATKPARRFNDMNPFNFLP